MRWIHCSVQLPPMGIYVLGYYGGGNWDDDDDDPNRVVVKRVERGAAEVNNLGAAYRWDSFGPGTYWARQITHWSPIPSAPRKPK